MPASVLVLGGARSGKTRRALTLASAYPERIYVATAEAGDAEMADRIARHQAERDAGWRTFEAPLALDEAIAAFAPVDPARAVLLVDCLTLWLSNLMFADRDIEAGTESLVAALAAQPADVILVSNELGLGLVPETALGRAFRDAQGRLNQRIAEVATVVEFVAAGLPLRLKPPASG